jgi:hypothetical protein
MLFETRVRGATAYGEPEDIFFCEGDFPKDTGKAACGPCKPTTLVKRKPAWRGWESPLAGHVHELRGPDAGAVGMAPAPRIQSSALAAEMATSLPTPGLDLRTHALGYSYSDDPDLMHGADSMSMAGNDNSWQTVCDMSGGSAGGPWTQPQERDFSDRPFVSANNRGYQGQPGTAGPRWTSVRPGARVACTAPASPSSAASRAADLAATTAGERSRAPAASTTPGPSAPGKVVIR